MQVFTVRNARTGTLSPDPKTESPPTPEPKKPCTYNPCEPSPPTFTELAEIGLRGFQVDAWGVQFFGWWVRVGGRRVGIQGVGFRIFRV